MREADSLLKLGGLSIDSTCVPHFPGRSERWSLSHHGAAARSGYWRHECVLEGGGERSPHVSCGHSTK